VAAFAVLFVALVGAVLAVELWGLPVGRFDGTQSISRSVAFDSLDRIADLQKERLLR
jgi:hypothetical protein